MLSIYLSILSFLFDSVGICAWSVRPDSSTDPHRIVILLPDEIKQQLSSEHRVLPRRHVLERLAAITGSIFVSPVAGYAVQDAIKGPAILEDSSDSSDDDESAKKFGTGRDGDAAYKGKVAANDDDSSSSDGESSDDSSDDEMRPSFWRKPRVPAARKRPQ